MASETVAYSEVNEVQDKRLTDNNVLSYTTDTIEVIHETVLNEASLADTISEGTEQLSHEEDKAQEQVAVVETENDAPLKTEDDTEEDDGTSAESSEASRSEAAAVSTSSGEFVAFIRFSLRLDVTGMLPDFLTFYPQRAAWSAGSPPSPPSSAPSWPRLTPTPSETSPWSAAAAASP